MLNDDEPLGTTLAERLRELVSDIEPRPELIDRIERETRSSQRTRFGRLSHRVRRRVLAAAIPAAAAIAAAILVFSGPAAPPSFAVSRGPDGAFLVTIHELQGVAGANDKLRELGVDDVIVVPITSGCSAHVDLTYTGIGTQRETTIRVTPSAIPPGTTVLLAAAPIPSNGVELALGRVTGPPPSCVAPGRSGLGISGVISTGGASSQTTTAAGQP